MSHSLWGTRWHAPPSPEQPVGGFSWGALLCFMTLHPPNSDKEALTPSVVLGGVEV